MIGFNDLTNVWNILIVYREARKNRIKLLSEKITGGFLN